MRLLIGVSVQSVNSLPAVNDWTVLLYCKSRAKPENLDKNAPTNGLDWTEKGRKRTLKMIKTHTIINKNNKNEN